MPLPAHGSGLCAPSWSSLGRRRSGAGGPQGPEGVPGHTWTEGRHQALSTTLLKELRSEDPPYENVIDSVAIALRN
jgi:hypothetical protein